MKAARTALIAIAIIFLALLMTSGQFLIVNQPQKSDVIVVLAGETERRPEHGLELLREGLAPRLILDVPAQARIYHWDQLELAQKYVQGLPEAAVVSVCPIYARSTKGEAQGVSRCLDPMHVRSVLLVTSDFHTRRTLSTFKRMIPQQQFSVAAAFDDREFGTSWWQRRQWSKVNFDEWLKLVWWELVERWR